MKRQTAKNPLVLAVLAGLPAVALLGWVSPVHAQYQVNNGNGHALDANPQIGSGGLNSGGGGSARMNQQSLNSAIITGNVGGLGAFHGNNGREINPNVFDGRSATAASDRLNFITGPTVGSGGVQSEAPLGTSPGVVQVYSGTTFVGTPPPGVAAPSDTGGSQLLVPSTRLDPLSIVHDNREDPAHDLNSNPDVSTPMTAGELDMVNSMDSAGNASIYSFSPLYGVRQMQSANTEDSFYQSKFGANNTSMPNPNAAAKPDAGNIQKMRDELKNNQVPDDQTDGQKAVPGAVPLSQSSLNNAVGAGDQALQGSALNSTLNDKALGGGMNSGAGIQNDLIIPPGKQSSTLKELERRYAQNKTKPDAIEQTRRFNEKLKANAQPDTGPGASVTPVLPGTGPDLGSGNVAPPVKTDEAPKPKSVLNGPDASAIDAKPMIITSLAAGIPAKGLSDLMKTAEDKMRQGKFVEAIDTYETAKQVASNNPFVYLGRMFAELGSSYYGRADLDLRRAVLLDPAVLSGRYDLNGFLGQDRVSFLQKELIDISTREKGARPFVLLAFVAHNAGDDLLAASDLDTATTRGGYAGLVDEMRTAWGIKATEAAPVQNPAPVPAQ